MRNTDKIHEMVNEIRDICMTTIVTDTMSLDEVIEHYSKALNKIHDLAEYHDE